MFIIILELVELLIISLSENDAVVAHKVSDNNIIFFFFLFLSCGDIIAQ